VSLVSFIVIKLKIRLYALTKGSTLETKETKNYPILSISRFGRDSMLSSACDFNSAYSFFCYSRAAAASGFCDKYCNWLILILLAISAKMLYLGTASP
jgi:hypothetical protein